MPHPSYSPELLFSPQLSAQMKEVLRGKCFADVEEVKQKTDRITKSHQNQWAQKLFWAEKPSVCTLHQKESTLKATEA